MSEPLLFSVAMELMVEATLYYSAHIIISIVALYVHMLLVVILLKYRNDRKLKVTMMGFCLYYDIL